MILGLGSALYPNQQILFLLRNIISVKRGVHSRGFLTVYSRVKRVPLSGFDCKEGRHLEDLEGEALTVRGTSVEEPKLVCCVGLISLEDMVEDFVQ